MPANKENSLQRPEFACHCCPAFSSSASPTRISMYTKKRTTLSSPAKGGLSLTPKNPPKGDARAVLPTSGKTPSNAQKKVYDSALENQELEREAENTA
jgi:hypothetical protein